MEINKEELQTLLDLAKEQALQLYESKRKLKLAIVATNKFINKIDNKINIMEAMETGDWIVTDM